MKNYNQLPQWIQNIFRVRVQERNSSGLGYSLINIDNNPSIGELSFENTPEGRGFWTKIYYQDKIPEPSTYVKVGDWVKITKGHTTWVPDMDKFDGKIVQVKEIDKASSGETIIHIKGSSRNFLLEHSHFVKAFPPEVKESPKEEPMEFKIGDRVIIHVDGYTNYRDDIGIIVRYSPDSHRNKWIVKWSDKQEYGYAASDLKLYGHANEIVVGSKVRMSQIAKSKWDDRDDPDNPHDLVGKVILIKDKARVYYTQLLYNVKWSNDKTNSYALKHLELVSEFGGDYYDPKKWQLEDIILPKEIIKHSQSNNNKNVRNKTIELQTVSPTIHSGSAGRGSILRNSNSEIRLGS